MGEGGLGQMQPIGRPGQIDISANSGSRQFTPWKRNRCSRARSRAVMTLESLLGFKSLTTHHCVTGSMRHIYVYNDHDISEDMLLGIGAGVSFSYWHFKGQLPFMGGRGNVSRSGEEGLEKTAGKRTGVAVEWHTTSSARKARRTLLEMLEAGQADELRQTLYNTYIFITSEGGTGGGLFRYMFSRFLRQVAEITGNARCLWRPLL
ncbi:MAG TPA: DUF4872 domain-containing protein [Chromatiaceae bacterium]|nr:DUF4872 domain-containing protein [Chromatiaceae bacterium]